MALQPWVFAMRYLESSIFLLSQRSYIKLLIGLVKWTIVAAYCAIVLWIMVIIIEDQQGFALYTSEGFIKFEKQLVFTWFALQILSTVFTVYAICKFL